MKQYARIKEYGDLLIPIALLEKIVDQGYLVRTEYIDGKEVISSLAPILNISVHNEQEVKSVLAQQVLEGN